jgi:hypothetical protein
MKFLTIIVLMCIGSSSKYFVTAAEEEEKVEGTVLDGELPIYIPRITFNGIGDCTDSEYTMIDEIVTSVTAHSTSSRELQISNSYPTMCSKICLGYVRGKCRSSTYPACNGYRRRLREVHDIETTTTTPCDTELEMYHTKLDALRLDVSESCQAFIGDRDTRTTDCLDRRNLN